MALPHHLETCKLFTFSEPCFIENIAIRPNGHLLLTTFREAELYNLDPDVWDPEPQLVARLPDVNSLLGIAEIAPDVFAIAGGDNTPQPFVFDEGTLKVFRVDLTGGIENSSIERVADVPDAPLLNGVCTVPENPHIVLSVDSHGKVWRVDMQTGIVDVALVGAELDASEDPARVPVGANGLKAFDGYLYWTNSGRETFCRVKIDKFGSPQGEVEVVARDKSGDPTVAYDDFDFDRRTGTAYLTQHPNAVVRVDREGKVSIFAGGNDANGTFQEPTALAVSKDGRKLYVACPGAKGEWKGNVVEVKIPMHR